MHSPANEALHTAKHEAVQGFLGRAVHECFDADAFGIAGGRTLEARRELSTNWLKNGLDTWLLAQGKSHRLEKLTEITDLRKTMFLSRDAPGCHSKGGETKTFLIYLVDDVSVKACIRVRMENGDAIYRAGLAMRRHCEIMSSGGWVLPPHACQELIDTLVEVVQELQSLRDRRVQNSTA